MDPFNHNKPNPLRSTDLMIAYLEDRAGEEDTRNIEQLIESDDLYRLSMEQLADQLADDPSGTKVKILNTEAGFEETLEAAKLNFIKQLENPNNKSDDDTEPGSSWPWWSFVVAIAIIGTLTWAFLVLSTDAPLHKDPHENLLVLTDETSLNNFLQDCGENSPGIGRPATISVYSALVEQFAEGNYKTAAQQFETLSQDSEISIPCKTFVSFYKGQSYLGAKELSKAEKAFAEVLNAREVNLPIKNAALWYLANLALAREAKDEARNYFEELNKSNGTDAQIHVEQLILNGYLGDTQKYLNSL